MEQSAVTRKLTEGLAFQAAGRANAAEAQYRRVLDVDPSQPDALHLLGMLINAKGRPAEGAGPKGLMPSARRCVFKAGRQQHIWHLG